MKEKISELIKTSLAKLNINEDVTFDVEKPKMKENGDFSCNVAMKLARILKDSPQNIAQKIVGNINDENVRIEIKNPGFINFFVSKDYLLDNINNVLDLKDKYGSSNIGKGISYNIEFVSANPTGTLHIGNARGGAYGDSLARILKFSGYDVTSEYYVNDAGNQIDNLGESVKYYYYFECNKDYVKPEKGYNGPEIKEIANKIKNEFGESKLDADIEFFKQYSVDILINRILEDLKEYRIDYDVISSEKKIREEHGMQDVVDILAKNGYVYEKDGASWFMCSKLFDDKDHVLIKEDKSFTYLVPDIVYHLDKFNRGYDKMIDIFGTDHHGYVARLKSSVKALGNDADKLDVKLLQLVRLVENNEVVKMSKRKGTVVTLKDLIDEVGVNAVRYFFSKYSLDTQMDFDLEQAKSKSNENPVYYVSYAYARICSILSTVKNYQKCDNYITIKDESAYNVLEKVYEFPEVVQTAAKKELPHLVTQYAYDLATLFHNYYAKNRIITDDETTTNENLCLISAVKITINNALNLIGVYPPEKM